MSCGALTSKFLQIKITFFKDTICTMNCKIKRTICALFITYAIAINIYCIEPRHVQAMHTSSSNCPGIY